MEQIINNVEGQKEDGEQEVEVDEATANKYNEIDSSGYLLALVKKGILKTKGKGKGKGQKSKRTCYDCGADDHLAAACPVRAARVAAGGPERLDKPDVQMGSGGGKKGAGKAMKGGKGKDGGKQGGTWTKERDHCGFWIPTRAQLKGSYLSLIHI